MYYSHVDALKPHTIENTVQDPAEFKVWKPLFCVTKLIYLIDLSKEKINEKWSALHSWVHLSYCFESLKSFEYTLTYKIFTVYELLLFPFSLCQTVDDVCYLCEETIVVYILDDPPKGDSSSLLYSTVHYCDDSRTGSFWNVSLNIYYSPSLALVNLTSSSIFIMSHF